MDKKYITSFGEFFKGPKITTFFDSNHALAVSLDKRVFANTDRLEETVLFGENTIETMGVGDGVTVRTVKTLDNHGKPVNIYFESTVVANGKVFTSTASAESINLSGRESVSKIIYTDSVVPTGNAAKLGQEEYITNETGEIIFDNNTQSAIVTARTRNKREQGTTHAFVSSAITLENGLTETIMNPVMPDGFAPSVLMGVVPFRNQLARTPHSIGVYHSEGDFNPLSEVINRPIFDSVNFEGAEVLENGERVVNPGEIAFSYINADSIAAKLAEEDAQ